MAKIEFFITRRNDLLANGELVDSFPSEHAAAGVAIRFAQDNDAPYSILYEAA